METFLIQILVIIKINNVLGSVLKHTYVLDILHKNLKALKIHFIFFISDV